MKKSYLIKNANVVSAETQSKSSVLIEEDLIRAVGDAAESDAAPHAEHIEASGCTLIPGLVDAH